MAKSQNSRRLKVTLDGVTYDVEIREQGATELQVTVNGQVHHLTVDDVIDRIPAGRGARTPTISPAPQSGTVVPPVATDKLTAPMPGDISEVLVAVGDRVEAGQGLIVLEAMKMKNILRASRGGRVAEIAVTIGQTVDYGEFLLRFE